jgi:hypothetical protein
MIKQKADITSIYSTTLNKGNVDGKRTIKQCKKYAKT